MAAMAAESGQGSQITRGSFSFASLYRPAIATSARGRSAGCVEWPIPIHLATNSGKRAFCASVRVVILFTDSILHLPNQVWTDVLIRTADPPVTGRDLVR